MVRSARIPSSARIVVLDFHGSSLCNQIILTIKGIPEPPQCANTIPQMSLVILNGIPNTPKQIMEQLQEPAFLHAALS